MEDTNTMKEESLKDGMVHLILSHSYTVFLIAVVFGLILDIIFPINIFNSSTYQYAGTAMIIIGSIIIYWAQSTSSHTKQDEEKGKARNFEGGPYKYSRNPTHIGLSIMTLGLAFLLNSVFSVLFTIVASIITKRIFLKKEEALLEEKYGQEYLDYKKKGQYLGMIYILAGNDSKNKSIYTKILTKGQNFVVLPSEEVSKELLNNYAGGISLFGEPIVIALDNILSSKDLILSDEDLKKLKDSPTTFILLEDKLLVSNEKKYKKYAEIKRFEEKTPTKKPAFNTFAIADAFARHDKVGTWINYREAIESGVDPEPISGILFWKIKTMLLAKPTPELQKQSGELVSLYHRAHRGECDFVIGLEQFILSSLSK